MKRELICILCPRGCRITVDEESLEVTGNSCPKGAQFGPQEITAPERLLTSTVAIEGALYRRIPVRTTDAIPLNRLPACMNAIHSLKLKSPITVGQVLIKNIGQSKANLVASRSM